MLTADLSTAFEQIILNQFWTCNPLKETGNAKILNFWFLD